MAIVVGDMQDLQLQNDLFLLLLLATFFGLPLLVAAASLWAQYQRRRRRTFVGKKKRQLIKTSDSTRARVHLFLYTRTRFGFVWDSAQAAMAVVSCLMYIVSTYDRMECAAISPTVDLILEFVVFAFFLTDYLLNYYLCVLRCLQPCPACRRPACPRARAPVRPCARARARPAPMRTVRSAACTSLAARATSSPTSSRPSRSPT